MDARTTGILWVAFLAASASAQYPMPHVAEDEVVHAMDSEPEPEVERLKCQIDPIKSRMDFAFRFQAGYVLRCPMKVFGGNKARIMTYIRITPQGGKPVFLSEGYSLPEMPPAMRARTDILKMSNEFELSGGFSMGEGNYTVDLLAIDSNTRVLRKTWEIRSFRNHEERNVQVALPERTAATLYNRSWDGKMVGDGKGLRVTILLNAAPRDFRATALRAWDRAMLIDSVSSILHQIPTESVRLVAFNLEQQREIFRDDKFDRQGLMRLARSLRALELGTVSYSALKNRRGWAEMLSGFTNQEVATDEPSDVVIFLGPMNRKFEKIPPELLTPAKSKRPHFYYFQFLSMWRRGNELPDAITHATSARNGTTFKIHSPGELGQAIQKLLDQTRKEQPRQSPALSAANP
jgi:hypothetical protein